MGQVMGGILGGGGDSSAGTTDSGGGMMGSILPLILGPGASIIGSLLGRSQNKAIDKGSKALSTVTGTTIPAGQMMVDRASKGQLTDPQQAQVNAYKAEQNARAQQYLADLGIPVSTAQVEYSSLVDRQALELANKLIDQSFKEGLEALRLGQSSATAQIQNAMQQKADLSKTISGTAEEIGRVLGTKPPPTSQVPGQPSTQPYVPPEWLNYGQQSFDIAAEPDPYAGTFSTDYT